MKPILLPAARRRAFAVLFAGLLGASGLAAQDAGGQAAGSQDPAQQPTYFKEDSAPWWQPKWALWATWEHDYLGDGRPADPPFRIDRSRGNLRLRWGFGDEDDHIHADAGLVGYLGTDSNATNLPYQDNERSNGTILDVADLRFRWIKAAGGLEAVGGLIENPLLGTELVWDSDLRIIGGGGKLFWRSEDGPVEELGLRAVDGDVRLLAGGRVKIRAAQAVLRLSTGPVDWTAHAGPWRLEARQQDAPLFLRSNPGPGGYVNPDGGAYYDYPDFSLNVFGVGAKLNWTVPIELKGTRTENRESGGRGQELQVWVGSPTRAWWPQFGYIRQMIDADGALASVNGDQWWFHANADGERYVAALNLPKQWRFQVDYVWQRRRDSKWPIERTNIGISKRF